ncbi:hypothetical protein [Vagococcus fluvialis]|uniref:hypothetical protein n=1 Tax=Vagococcus fluvialis TaxID=2738 RepID=UPI003793AD9D
MKKSDLDRLNPKADEVSGLGFFNRGTLSKDDYSDTNGKKGLLFYSIFIGVFVCSLLLILNSSYYLKYYGDSLSALAITLILILLVAFVISLISNYLYNKIRK